MCLYLQCTFTPQDNPTIVTEVDSEEEGCLTDDDEVETLKVEPSAVSSNFNDKQHHTLFQRVIKRTPPSVNAATAPETPLEQFLVKQNLSHKRFVVRSSGWVRLAEFRAVVSDAEKVRNKLGPFAYYESDGLGVLLLHALATVAVIAVTDAGRERLVREHDEDLCGEDFEGDANLPTKFSRVEYKSSETFLSPCLMQTGKPVRPLYVSIRFCIFRSSF